MARKPNFNFQKRQKELDRQKKKAEKAERKRQNKEGQTDADSLILSADDPDLAALGILPRHVPGADDETGDDGDADDDPADDGGTGR